MQHVRQLLVRESESWNGHVNTLYDVHKNELQNNLQVARTKLRKKLGHETDVIDVAVTYDGTWSKRGHTANFGFAFVTPKTIGVGLPNTVKVPMQRKN